MKYVATMLDGYRQSVQLEIVGENATTKTKAKQFLRQWLKHTGWELVSFEAKA